MSSMGNADLMPRHALPHPVELTGLRTQPSRQLAAPLLVERRDQEFVAGLLADLALPQRHDELRSQAPRSQGSMLRLFQPVQRVFNMAVLEAWCDVPGTPRLDPAKIDSAGLVIRKLVDGQPRAWIKAGTRILGWEQVDGEVDPAADKRAPALSLGDAATDRVLPSNRLRRAAGMAALLQHDADITEDVIPLFVAPPEVCSAAGRTLLFGNLPVTSGEQAEADQKRPGYGASRAERDLLQAHLYGFFRSGSSWKPAQPGVTIDRSHVESAQKKPAQSDDERRDYELLLELLRQACIEFDVLGESAEAKALFAQLQRISVERDIHINGRIEVRQQPAGDFLRQAARVMLDDEPGASFVMPHRRAALAENIAGDFFEASLRALDAQSRKLGIGRGRYEPERNDEQPRYVARAF
ncbi:MAG TPA: hypothetical protein VLI06_16420, partial [Solimonas sp.]|nr:hypothetical protein [Solimonas sp.]